MKLLITGILFLLAFQGYAQSSQNPQVVVPNFIYSELPVTDINITVTEKNMVVVTAKSQKNTVCHEYAVNNKWDFTAEIPSVEISLGNVAGAQEACIKLLPTTETVQLLEVNRDFIDQIIVGSLVYSKANGDF